MPINIYDEPKILSPLQYSLMQFKKNSLAMVGFWGVLIFVLIALFAPFIAPHDLSLHSLQHELLPPSWNESGYVDYFLGTDDLGNDLFSQLIYGTRYTFGGALLLVLTATLIGGAIGIMAGMSQGILSSTLHHLLDTALSIPSLLLAIIVVAILGPGLFNTMLAIWLAILPQFIHSTYTTVHSELQKEYITAIKLDGANKLRILRFGILPNILDSLIAQTTRALSTAILDISALGFIGLGAQVATPEWGNILANNKDLLFIAPWTVTIPGFTILLAIFFTNLFGEGLREAINEGTQ